MKRKAFFVLISYLFVYCCFGQPRLPEMAQIKAAAERGDAKAQDQLGDAYYSALIKSEGVERAIELKLKKTLRENNDLPK